MAANFLSLVSCAGFYPEAVLFSSGMFWACMCNANKMPWLDWCGDDRTKRLLLFLFLLHLIYYYYYYYIYFITVLLLLQFFTIIYMYSQVINSTLLCIYLYTYIII